MIMLTKGMDKHPKQRLIFFVAEDSNDLIRERITRLITELTNQRTWVLGPPTLIDSIDDSTTRDGDTVDETLGGVLEIYSAMTPEGLPQELDLAHLEEVEYLIRAVQQVSQDCGIAFEFELDGRFVGAIEDGMLDHMLEVGLIGEWRKHLERSRS
jgi:hypothetical protein